MEFVKERRRLVGEGGRIRWGRSEAGNGRTEKSGHQFFFFTDVLSFVIYGGLFWLRKAPKKAEG
jgi:hypothetical protein